MSEPSCETCAHAEYKGKIFGVVWVWWCDAIHHNVMKGDEGCEGCAYEPIDNKEEGDD